MELLRDLIFEVARETEGVGAIEEALRWGEPSYLTTASKSGSTIRINFKETDRGVQFFLFFNCKTKLVATFKERFGRILTFGGNRSIILNDFEVFPFKELRECIALALTYNQWK